MASTLGINYFPTKPFSYEAFIDELRQLRHEAASSFAVEERVAHSTSFKRWRLRLDDLLRRIGALGWSVHLGHTGRAFAATNEFEDDDASFDTDLADTLIELDLLIKNFEMYGTPPLTHEPRSFGAAPPAAPAPLLPPEKVTWHWLKQNMTVGGWGMVATATAAISGAAFTLGHWSATYEHAAANPPVAVPSLGKLASPASNATK